MMKRRKKGIHAHSRDVLLAMMRQGQCTQAEAADIARVSRQAVAQWVGGEIDIAAARSHYLLALYMRLLTDAARAEASQGDRAAFPGLSPP